MNFMHFLKTVVGLQPPVMGILGSIFGESPGAEIKSQPTISEPQSDVQYQIRNIFQRDQPLPEGVSSPAQGEFVPYQQPIVGDLSSLEQLSLEGIEELSRGIVAGGVPGQGQEVAAGSQQALLDVLGQGPQDFEEYFQAAVAQPLIEQFTRDILPAISARQASGFFGSERMKQDIRATEELSEALASSRGRLGFEARENQLDRVIEALGIAPEVAGMGAQLTGEELGLLERALGAGRVPREVETSGRLAEYEEFLRGQQRDQELINQMIRFASAPTQETVGVAKGGSSGLLGSFLSGIAPYAGAAIGSMFGPAGAAAGYGIGSAVGGGAGGGTLP